jgi:hypothetical protein
MGCGAHEAPSGRSTRDRCHVVGELARGGWLLPGFAGSEDSPNSKIGHDVGAPASHEANDQQRGPRGESSGPTVNLPAGLPKVEVFEAPLSDGFKVVVRAVPVRPAAEGGGVEGRRTAVPSTRP